MNWFSHSPQIWKISTLKSLIKRALVISSTKESLDTELMHIKYAFIKKNNYPPQLVQKMIHQGIEKLRSNNNLVEKEGDKEKFVGLTLNIPYGGIIGENLIKKMKESIMKKLGSNIKIRILYKAVKLGSKFQMKDKTKKEHMHNIIYKINCPDSQCQAAYVGQTKSRCQKRLLEHNGRDKSSHVWKHSMNEKHQRVWMNDVKVLGKGYRTDFTRKISESLFIRDLKPVLNKQKEAYKLKLFN